MPQYHWTPGGLRRAIQQLDAPRRACALLPTGGESLAFLAGLAEEASHLHRSVTIIGSSGFIAGVSAVLGGEAVSLVEVSAPWRCSADAVRDLEALEPDTVSSGGPSLLLLDAVSVLGPGADAGRVLSAQSAIESVLPQIEAVVVTVYARESFGAPVLADAVLSSPSVFVWDMLCDNARHVSPDALMTDGHETLLVDRLLRESRDSENSRHTIAEHEQRYHALVENSPDSVFVHSGGAIVYANRAAAAMVGASSPDEVLGRSVMSFVHADSLETVGGRIKLMLEENLAAPRMLERFTRLDQTSFYAEAVASPLIFDGKPAIQVLMRDQTERHATEEELRFKSFLLDSVVDGIIVRDPADMAVLYVNEATCELSGNSRKQFFSSNTISWVPAEERDAILHHFDSAMRLGTGTTETFTDAGQGQKLPLEVRSSVVSYLGRRVLMSILRDISERKNAQATIEHMALHDPLTGLANRALLMDRLELALAHVRRSGEKMALILLDVDHFKTINDTAGHGVGDLLLQGIAARLTDLVREDDTVARLGGDEFTLVLPDIGSLSKARHIADKILKGFREPFTTGSSQVHATASLGVAFCEGGHITADELLRDADLAMYSAKEGGRNSYALFDRSMNETATERFVLRNDLRDAVENGEMALHYQPIVDLADGAVLGAEALCRWMHPLRGSIPPMTFIPLAEEMGVICSLGTWVLREACSEAKLWADSGHEGLPVSVNLSPRQLREEGFVQLVQDVLGEAGLPAELLQLEITETVAMQDAPRLIGVFRELRALGVRIAIDDFGTGYSSLHYLKQFPIDTLKVDQTFVRDVCDNEESLAIATAIVSLARALRLEVVAEGVETDGQRQALLGSGCKRGQGYLFSRAVPGPEFRRSLVRSAAALRLDI